MPSRRPALSLPSPRGGVGSPRPSRWGRPLPTLSSSTGCRPPGWRESPWSKTSGTADLGGLGRVSEGLTT